MVMTLGLEHPWFTNGPVTARMRQVARVLTHHGLGALADQAGLRRFMPRFTGRARHAPVPQPVRVRLALGELGVAPIKLGQMLSTRADLLPVDFITELSRLQDSAPAVALEHVRRVIEEEFGVPLEQVYAAFDPVPLASASIGQVHAAMLPDGASVVVKVRRPGVVEEVERDLEILTRLGRWVQEHTPFGENYEVMPLVEEFAWTLRNELDYVREGHNAERLRVAFADDPTVLIPRVYVPYTTTRVLTMERVDGVKVTDGPTLDRLGIPRRTVAENAVRFVLREVLELGFFHADPHPGNFFVQPDASLAIMDFGMVGRLNETTRLRLMRGGLAAIENDAEGLADELFALGVAGRKANRPGFIRDLAHVLGMWEGRSIHELSAAAITGELTAIAFRHRLQLPGDLAMLLRVIAMSEGIGLALDPEFRYIEFASPIIRAHWESRRSLCEGLDRAGKAALEAADLALELPRRSGRLLGRIERGELEMNVRHEGFEQLAREFQHMTNRLVLAMILSASVVALGVALGARSIPGIEPLLRALFALGFAFSLAFGAWVLVAMWRSRR